MDWAEDAGSVKWAALLFACGAVALAVAVLGSGRASQPKTMPVAVWYTRRLVQQIGNLGEQVRIGKVTVKPAGDGILIVTARVIPLPDGTENGVVPLKPYTVHDTVWLAPYYLPNDN